MPIAGDYISELDEATPAGETERVRVLDDHIRLLKHVLLTQFPGLDGTIPVTASEADLNMLTGTAALGGVDVPSGTRMLFQQTNAPVGWTKETNAAYNNAALRMTTGTVTTNAGTKDFDTAFKSSVTVSGPSANNIFIQGTFVAPVSAASDAHTHNFNLDVKYFGAIVASKDA